MTSFHQRVLQVIKDDFDALRQVAITLELARYRGGDVRRLQWDASKVFSRHSAFSAEFFLPYMIMMLVFVIHPPIEPLHSETIHQITSRVVWAAGFILNFWFIYRSKGWLLYHVYFPYGIAAFVVSAIVLYSCSSLAPIMIGNAFSLYVQGQEALQGLAYVKLFTIVPAVVTAIVLLSMAYRMMYSYPLFTSIAGERLFLALLPVGKRGDLISVSADDHYIQVASTNGISHIRLNFCNALDLLKDASGLQVHRSHWVSLKAIEDLWTEANGKTIIRLVDETEIPVARSRIKELKARLATTVATSD